jgi:hypothetical protein
MNFFLLGLFILLFGIACFSQVEIKLEDVSKHVGDSVKVCGKVFSGRYLEQSKGSPTLLNMGAAYPNQLLTIVIWGDLRKEFSKAPEELFMDKDVCVIGRIELFREKPQIVVRERE